MNYPQILSEIIPEPPPQTYLRKSLFEISLSHISTKRFPPKILFEKYEEIVIAKARNLFVEISFREISSCSMDVLKDILLTDAEMGKDGGQDVLGRDALPGDFA